MSKKKCVGFITNSFDRLVGRVAHGAYGKPFNRLNGAQKFKVKRAVYALMEAENK